MCWLSAFALDDKSKERRDIPLKEVSRRSLLKRNKKPPAKPGVFHMRA